MPDPTSTTPASTPVKPVPPTPVATAAGTPSSPPTVTFIASEWAKFKSDSDAWLSKQESWLERNWVALVGHASTIITVIGAAKWLSDVKAVL